MYNFEVEKAPVFVHGEEVKGRKAIWRPDTRRVLGIVSDKYEVITHEEVISGFREALKGTEFTENIGLTKDGAHMYATYTLRQHTVEVAKGDVVGLQFTAKNSYDGGTSLAFSLGALRLVCTNGMVLSDRFFTYSQKHFGKNVHVDVAVLSQKIGIMAEQFQHKLPQMQALARTDFTGNLSEENETLAKKLPGYLIEAAIAEFEKAGNGTIWGFYNALTHAITHNMRRASPQAQLRYGRIAWQLATDELMRSTGAEVAR